jgi:hypothetical protein
VQRRGGTLLDTGPAFGLLVSRLLTERGPDLWPGPKWSTRAVSVFLRFLRMPGRRPILVPPGALVEVHHLVRSRRRVGTDEEDASRIFWSFARDELLSLGVAERVVRLAEIRPDRLQKLGPLDAALFRLAERREGAVLLSTDASLRRAFESCGLPALSPEEVFGGAA